jgi:hypothetical protein
MSQKSMPNNSEFMFIHARNVSYQGACALIRGEARIYGRKRPKSRLISGYQGWMASILMVGLNLR